MLTLATRLKVLLFAVIGAIAIAYVGLHYADLGHYVGASGYYTVRVDLADTGGLLPNADVTYRGVSVGRVGSIDLTPGGVRAVLHIRDSAPRIPADSRAVIGNLSAIGEVYLDLRPASAAGPYLASGTRIPAAHTQTPQPVTSLLTSLNTLTASVPLGSLRTVVDELGKAFGGQSQNLQALLDNGNSFVLTADKHLQPTLTLLTSGRTALRTQNDEAGAFASFSRNIGLLARQLDTSDPDLRAVIAAAGPAADQFSGLLHDITPGFGVTVANLLTTADLLQTRVGGVQELLVKVPQAIAAGTSMISGGRLDFGLVTTFFSPLPCTTGYGTTIRNGLDTSSGPALNTGAACTLSPSSGTDVRGSANAPSGGVPKAALPGALGQPGGTSSPAGLGGLLGLGGSQ